MGTMLAEVPSLEVTECNLQMRFFTVIFIRLAWYLHGESIHWLSNRVRGTDPKSAQSPRMVYSHRWKTEGEVIEEQ